MLWLEPVEETVPLTLVPDVNVVTGQTSKISLNGVPITLAGIKVVASALSHMKAVEMPMQFTIIQETTPLMMLGFGKLMKLIGVLAPVGILLATQGQTFIAQKWFMHGEGTPGDIGRPLLGADAEVIVALDENINTF